ncbi:prolipoprotein diacylglyceryl transferase [Fibrella sp. HMF5335]|uniref:Phosphatidylglycerol--prolipoprotein diacylglyceryl transferase n=1 Tax=Fibrella rubiginis TaxID=2817060 RepID=A0A939GFG6_9BACT|nr:prolipoprotein diacylglyceryl transferase [Fibrella rubiginis]MBO0936823.1 prolipoprotein diacylglyceryl transferase [Fibrella rubiginis]
MLAYIVWDANPVLFSIDAFTLFGFQFPQFEIRWYGLLFAAGFLIGMQIMTRIFRKEGKPQEDLDALLIYMVISTVLGARIGHYLFYEPEVLFRNPLEVILPPYRGLASHGATIGILTALWLYSRRKSSRLTGQTFLWTTDRIVIVVALAGACIRLGNLMNHEIVGLPTTLPWGFIFKYNNEYPVGVPRHPAQLYESLSMLALFFVLLAIWNRRREHTPRGLLLGIFLIWCFGLRFLYEYLKENQVAFENTLPLNMGQILSIPAVLVGVYFVWRSRRTPIPTSEQTTA